MGEAAPAGVAGSESDSDSEDAARGMQAGRANRLPARAVAWASDDGDAGPSLNARAGRANKGEGRLRESTQRDTN